MTVYRLQKCMNYITAMKYRNVIHTNRNVTPMSVRPHKKWYITKPLLLSCTRRLENTRCESSHDS